MLIRHLKLAYLVGFGKATHIKHLLITIIKLIIIETIAIHLMSLEKITIIAML